MAKQPFFSVIVLAFNRPQRLKLALSSVRSQTFKDFETLVVDGGRGEECKKICQAQSFPIRYFKIKDKGIGHARDFGLKKAIGHFAAFLDDDDEFLPQHLKARFKDIKKYPKVHLWYNGFKTQGSKFVPDLLNPHKRLKVSDPTIFHAGTAVVNRKLALKVGGFSKGRSKYYPDNLLAVFKKANLKSKVAGKKTYIYKRFGKSYTNQLITKL
jgi:glycosyltransferase involved in cell wall biosynthesis